MTTEIADGVLRHYCECGRELWAGPADYAATVPKVTELIICRSCGKDGSVPISLRYRLAYAKYRLGKQVRIYGWWATLRRSRGDPNVRFSEQVLVNLMKTKGIKSTYGLWATLQAWWAILRRPRDPKEKRVKLPLMDLFVTQRERAYRKHLAKREAAESAILSPTETSQTALASAAAAADRGRDGSESI